MRVSAFILFLFIIYSVISCRQPEKKPVKVKKNYRAYDTLFHARQMAISYDDYGINVKISFPKFIDTSAVVVYYVNGIYKNRNLGFIIGVPAKPASESGFGKGLYFKRSGKESDYFLHTLAELYHQPIDTTAQFVDSISLHYVDLRKIVENEIDKGNYPIARVHFSQKVFFEEKNSTEEPGELYITPNEQHQWLELGEKDTFYRSAIINCLTKKPKRK